MKVGEVIRSMDWLMLGSAVLLVAISLAMVFSSSYTTMGLLSSRFTRQLLSFGIGIVLCVLVARIPYHSLRSYWLVFYSAGIIGLLAVLATNKVIMGATNRLVVAGDYQLQPSEFIKVGLAIGVSAVLANYRSINLRSFLTSCFLFGVPVILIMLEPDLGVASLIVGLWAGLLIFLGLPWVVVGLLGLVGAGGLAAAWFWVFAEYQKARLLVFINPAHDPHGAGYNIVQSIVAFGSGRFFGRGLGHGPQSQLQFLPEQHTDFILASIGEELGFVGVMVIFILYAIILWRILRIASTTRDPFGRLLAVSAFLILFISFVVSAGMNMGILPVTGIPLPLLSYGGSNLVSTLLLLGVVQSIHVYSKWVQAPPEELSHF